MLKLPAALILLTTLASAHAQTAAPESFTLQEVFSGKIVSLQLSPSNLKGEYRAIELLDDNDSAKNRIDAVGGSRQARALAMSRILITKFQEFMVNGHRQLVCYQATTSQLLNKQPRGLPSTAFRLTLVNLDLARGFKLAEPDLASEVLHNVMSAETNVFPAFQAARRMAARTSTLSNVKQLATLHLIYLQDHDELIPKVKSTEGYFRLLRPYSKNSAIEKTLNPNGGSIEFNLALAGVNFTQIASPAETVLFYDSKTWPDGYRCVAFADGHAKALDKGAWLKASKSIRK